MTMAAIVTYRHAYFDYDQQNFAVVDHLFYIDWLVELFSPESRM